MDSSNPLPTVQTTSPSLSTAQPSSVQPGLSTLASIQSPAVSAMMHLQQLNIQQSLLLQQYALSQQTLSNTVKTPAEIAAARAAEISKQLEGFGASEKKTSERSKSRSLSKSPSRSPSRSKSKSRSPSRSPIKRRRGHSRSLSPIRYKRDYYPSYRSRDNYGYRGRNYRSYYRGGYNDYSRYRYGRDYDYHYRRRSRSREWRRSRTRSRSPKRDRSRARRRSPTPSPPLSKRSQTGSPTDSRKGSVSPPVKRYRPRSRPTSEQSLSREATRSRSVISGSANVSPARSSSSSESQEKSSSDHIVEKSPLTELSEETGRNQTAFRLKRTNEGSSAARQGGRASSSSPSRSRSVSVDDDKYTNASKKASVKERHEIPEAGSSENHDDILALPGKNFASEAEDSEFRKNYSGHGRRLRKQTRSSDAISGDDSQSEESMDDWRHDLKKVVRGKAMSGKEGDYNSFEERAKSKFSETQFTERSCSLTINANDCDLKEEVVVHSASFVEHDDFPMVAGELHAVSDKGHENAVVCDDKSLEQVAISEEPKEVTDGDNDLIFEGPQPANVVHDERKEEGLNSDAQFVDVDARKGHNLIPDHKKAKEMNTAEDDDYHVGNPDGQICSYEDKARERSRSRDSKKQAAGLTKNESRKSKHRRHKNRHKHESVDEDSEVPRKRHKRKHRRGSEHGLKERKKRRHKRRSRSTSTEDSSSEGEIEVRNSSGKRRKSSKKRKASKRDLSKSFTSSASMGSRI
ncbi:hypothetical protein GOP47_0004460 [Adiantum capillus-veneris]|uniref:Uncharacterized protein n=1 Tax=Adiantum capillus-veneris TaxID=13818 RepID=A0A9D4ZPL2_ADICA|nr:hypothetical protein GOP47_0004460 [Adiantum capillus-veneris]